MVNMSASVVKSSVKPVYVPGLALGKATQFFNVSQTVSSSVLTCWGVFLEGAKATAHMKSVTYSELWCPSGLLACLKYSTPDDLI